MKKMQQKKALLNQTYKRSGNTHETVSYTFASSLKDEISLLA